MAEACYPATMVRYFMHVKDRHGFTFDDTGCQLPSLAAVRRRALENARSLMCDDVSCGVLDLRGAIEVTDERGATVMVLPFSECVEIWSNRIPPEYLPAFERDGLA